VFSLRAAYLLRLERLRRLAAGRLALPARRLRGLGREKPPLLLLPLLPDSDFLPKEPMNTLTRGAICETLPTTFCTLVTVERIPSSPPIRSTKPLISVKFAYLVKFAREKPLPEAAGGAGSS